MAVTSIWAVTTHYERAIEYVMNPEKTIEKPELTPEAIAANDKLCKKANFVSELRHLLAERRRLNTEKEKAIRHHDLDLINAKTAEIGEISKQIREVRKQIKMCEELYIDSDKVMEAAYEELKKSPLPLPTPKPKQPEQPNRNK